MQKNLYVVGFVAVSVLAFISSCSDPAAQAKKAECDSIRDRTLEEFTKVDTTGATGMAKTTMLINQNALADATIERRKAAKAEYTAKCK